MSEMNRKADGFSLVSVIFILVVLAGMTGYMLKVTEIQQRIVTQEILETKAFMLAESVLDYYQNTNAASTNLCLLSPTGQETLTPPADTGFNGFTVTAQCRERFLNPYDATQNVAKVQVTTEFSGIGNYLVRRHISGQIIIR